MPHKLVLQASSLRPLIVLIIILSNLSFAADYCCKRHFLENALNPILKDRHSFIHLNEPNQIIVRTGNFNRMPLTLCLMFKSRSSIRLKLPCPRGSLLPIPADTGREVQPGRSE